MFVNLKGPLVRLDNSQIPVIGRGCPLAWYFNGQSCIFYENLMITLVVGNLQNLDKIVALDNLELNV